MKLAKIAKNALRKAEPKLLQIFKNPAQWDGNLTASLDPIVKDSFRSSLTIALEAIKQNKQVYVMCPLSKVEKINLEWLYTYGKDSNAMAQTADRKPGEQVCSLAKLYKECGFVCLCDENGVPYTDKNFNVIEKEVIKEIKTVQSGSGFKLKEVTKAIDNTQHKMSKTYQPDLVRVILDELKKELKL